MTAKTIGSCRPRCRQPDRGFGGLYGGIDEAGETRVLSGPRAALVEQLAMMLRGEAGADMLLAIAASLRMTSERAAVGVLHPLRGGDLRWERDAWQPPAHAARR